MYNELFKYLDRNKEHNIQVGNGTDIKTSLFIICNPGQ